jgi:hypothetical protein
VLPSAAALVGAPRCLGSFPTHLEKDYPPFVLPGGYAAVFDRASLASRPEYTALAGAVFYVGRFEYDEPIP